MVGNDIRHDLPPGLLSGMLFFAVVLTGSGYIVFSKLHEFSAFNVTAVPVLVMVGYALILGAARLFRLRDDQSGDNLYYMGFLFTLTSLAVSLYQFDAARSAEQIVQNFGIAIASTIAGITLRILFNQMRRDPVEVEATARLELAEASRRVKRELDSTVLEFSYFRRMAQQSINDALAEVKETLGDASDKLAGEIRRFAVTAGKPLEDASKKSGETLDSLNEKMVTTLETVSAQLVEEGERLTRSTASIVRAVDAVAARLTSLQTPDQIIEIKLAPMIQGLTRAINSFSKSAETQAQTIEANLRQTQAVGAVVTQLVQELRAAEAARAATGPWGTISRDPINVRKASSAMDGEIIQQRSSYRQGLVLGLTMAEIMLLLVFCLLIAMATFLKSEQTKLEDAKQQLEQQHAQNQRDRDLVVALGKNAAIADKLRGLSGLTDPKEIDKLGLSLSIAGPQWLTWRRAAYRSRSCVIESPILKSCERKESTSTRPFAMRKSLARSIVR